MNILHIAGEYPPARIGGIATYLENVASRQARAHRVGVCVVRGERYRDDPPLEPSAVEVRFLDFDPGGFEGPLVDGAALAEALGPDGFGGEPWDVIHTHDWYGALPALHVAARCGAPVVASAHLPLRHGFTYAHHGVSLRQKVRLEALGIRQAAGILAPSGAVGSLLLREYDVPEDALAILPNGVDTARFCPGDARAEAPTVLSVSRLSEQKGLGYLLEAFASVREARPAAQLVIAGEGPARAGLEAEIARRGLADSVTLRGYVPHAELPALYRSAHVFVSASVYEPFGLTTLEAMACGTAVVASSLGGASEFVEDGVDGWLVAPHAGLAEAMGQALDAPERFAAPARKKALTLSWDRIVTALDAFYGSLRA